MSYLTKHPGYRHIPKWYREKREYPLKWLERLLKWIAALVLPVLIAISILCG